MKTAIRLISAINRFLAEATGYLVGLLMLILVFDSLGQILNRQVPGAVEIAVFILVASAYLGLSHTEEMRGHVKVEAVLVRLPPRCQKWLTLAWGLVSVVVVAITAYAAGLKALAAYVEGEAIAGAVPWPLFPVRAIIALCLVMFCIQLLANLMTDATTPPSGFIQKR